MLQISVDEKSNYEVVSSKDAINLNGKEIDCDIQFQPNGIISIIYNNKSYTATVDKVDKTAKEMLVTVDGQQHKIAIKEPIDQLLTSMGMDLSAMQKAEPVKAPMPGKVLKVMVEEGQAIQKGDALLILEAMKMENVLKAATDGTVKAINIEEQTAVEKGAILIELE